MKISRIGMYAAIMAGATFTGINMASIHAQEVDYTPVRVQTVNVEKQEDLSTDISIPTGISEEQPSVEKETIPSEQENQKETTTPEQEDDKETSPEQEATVPESKENSTSEQEKEVVPETTDGKETKSENKYTLDEDTKKELLKEIEDEDITFPSDDELKDMKPADFKTFFTKLVTKLKDKVIGDAKGWLISLTAKCPVFGEYTKFLSESLMDEILGKEDNTPSKEIEKLQEIQKELQNIKNQIKQSETDIMNDIDYQSNINRIDNINAFFNDLETIYTKYYKAAETASKSLNNENTIDNVSITVAKNVFKNIFNTGENGGAYYEKFLKMSHSLTGDGIIQIDDIFKIFQSITSVKYNYNTQTFGERKFFANYTKDLYEKRRLILVAAMNFELNSLQTNKESFEKQIQQLELIKQMGNFTKKQLEQIDQEITNIKIEMGNLDTNIKTVNACIDEVEKARVLFMSSFDASLKEVKDEDSLDTVFCYRNKQHYKRDLDIVNSQDKDFKSNNTSLRSGKAENFFKHTNSAKNGTPAYNSALEDEWKGNDYNNNNTLKNSIGICDNQYKNLDFLNKIAIAKGKSLMEDISTAFRIKDKNVSFDDLAGVYKNGHFDEKEAGSAGEVYVGEKKFLTFWTRAVNAEATNFDFSHVVNYIGKDSKETTSTLTRRFQVVKWALGKWSFNSMYRNRSKIIKDENVKLAVINFA